ncbi:hypothetical protein EJF36_12015 [Bacillus sp. HMF5848]|uniref:BC1872 family protein n=1 Tax=Bacillus sp. HMF5848 TaxID=2495421 RepID=UPI000F7A701C|nr:hypothetical protein [Bacillus sp. HMF5848]RSK27544.1 hypothetical protein EJF36_12015 [Bacillus sp. HMF5848]
MNKTEAIARRILGWKLNRWDRWFDYEKGVFISVTDFQPEQNIDHAMLVVDRLQKKGITYEAKETPEFFEVRFNNVTDTGKTLAEAITNTAYLIANSSSDADEWL